MFTDIREASDILRVIARMKEIARKVDRTGGMKSIIIGMPNTGKSSMLNVIRRHATDRKCLSKLLGETDFRESGENVKSSWINEGNIKCH
jgi:tRNA U34 5-carboxymethylaminomethyl modifying GTPase MnmE/TrmE